MKKLSDYLHLYLGAKCSADGNEFNLAGVEITDTGTLAYDGTIIDGIHQCWWVENCGFKLFLRPISDISNSEADEIGYDNAKVFLKDAIQYRDGVGLLIARDFHYLLNRRFDLFGLIEAGLAIQQTRETL